MPTGSRFQPVAPQSNDSQLFGPARSLPPHFAGAHLTRARMVVTLGALSASTIVVIVIAPAFGSVHIDLLRAISEPFSPDRAILLGARVPRVLMGAAVGA